MKYDFLRSGAYTPTGSQAMQFSLILGKSMLSRRIQEILNLKVSIIRNATDAELSSWSDAISTFADDEDYDGLFAQELMQIAAYIENEQEFRARWEV